MSVLINSLDLTNTRGTSIIHTHVCIRERLGLIFGKNEEVQILGTQSPSTTFALSFYRSKMILIV